MFVVGLGHGVSRITATLSRLCLAQIG
jgi:hypothetical protein